MAFDKFGSLAQLVQSVCLTSRGSGVRLPQLPQKNAFLHCREAFFRTSPYGLRWVRIGRKPRCHYGRSRRNRSSLPLRRLESDAEDRRSYGRSRRAILYRHNDCAAGGPFFCAGDNPCSDSQIDPLKSEIAAAVGLFPSISCSDSQVYPMKSGIAATAGLFPGNLCSDSQVYPMKSGITAALGLFPGKILQ